MSEKGGLNALMSFVPLENNATTYQLIAQSIAGLKAEIYEIEGISDVMRGQSQAYDNVAVTAAKQQFGTSRLNDTQREIALYLQELFRLKCHLITKFYTPQTILARAGRIPQADIQFVQPALALIKSEEIQDFVLEVSVDSIQTPNQNMEKAERTALVQSVGTMLGQILPYAQQVPEIVPLGLGMIQFVSAGYKGGETLEGLLDQSFQQLQQAGTQKAQTPPQPSPEQIKAQTQQQKIAADLQQTQMQEETKRVIAQMQAQLDAFANQLKGEQNQLKARELDQKAAKDAADTRVAAAQVAVDATNAVHSNAVDHVTLVQGGSS